MPWQLRTSLVTQLSGAPFVSFKTLFVALGETAAPEPVVGDNAVAGRVLRVKVPFASRVHWSSRPLERQDG